MINVSPFGPDTQRYWDRRYQLFSRFDDGIRLDREGLFSVKPEASALEVAKRLPGATVLDAFCGAGGSAIGFAREGKRVIAVDINAERLAMARHNAALYGVADNITFINGDVRELPSEISFDSVFFDPPWGGPDYFRLEHFTFGNFAPDANPLIKDMVSRSIPSAFSLPKNFDKSEFSRLGLVCDFMPYRWNDGALAFETAFWPQLRP